MHWNFLHRLTTACWVWGLVLIPRTALAQGFTDRLKSGLQTAGAPAGLEQSPGLEVLIGRIIGIALSLVGVILFAFLVYAGFLWMTAGGDSSKVEKAQTMLRNTIIGLIIVVLAYAISNFVVDRIIEIQSGSSDV
ncbi:hypothetical protein GF380_00090 [Candidatus Uhrbacteria bacterium]|nr:hypothetical protein [Candidatus Uhrbacteria bacterium]MBD3283824.1 hypothetical protein [Candidatus Uhrbacteria bacterium]